jgi:hypothetical protein
MTRDNCKFSFWRNTTKTADVEIKDGFISCMRYTEDFLDLPFGKVPDRAVTRKTLDLFFREHSIPEHRADLSEWLKFYNLDKYDAFKICRITNGVMAQSPYHIVWADKEEEVYE